MDELANIMWQNGFSKNSDPWISHPPWPSRTFSIHIQRQSPCPFLLIQGRLQWLPTQTEFGQDEDTWPLRLGHKNALLLYFVLLGQREFHSLGIQTTHCKESQVPYVDTHGQPLRARPTAPAEPTDGQHQLAHHAGEPSWNGPSSS